MLKNKEIIMLKIGDVAKKTNMTLRALRYYEEIGLIGSEVRTKGNFRLYNPTVLNRISLINSLKKLGYSLEEIKVIIGDSQSLETNVTVINETLDILKLKKNTILSKMNELQNMMDEVEGSMKTLEECITCRLENINDRCDPLCDNKHTHIK